MSLQKRPVSRLGKKQKIAIGAGVILVAAIERSITSNIYAECFDSQDGSYSYCINPNPDPLCITDKTSKDLTVGLSAGNQGIYDVNISENTSFGLTFNPSSHLYFDGTPAWIINETFVTNVGYPNLVTPGSHIDANVTIQSRSDDYYGVIRQTFQTTAAVRVEHQDTVPVINSISQTINSTSIDAKVSVSDPENNNLDLKFDISTVSNFSSILQTATVSVTNTSTPTQYIHTFSGLDPATTYFWRVTATETNGQASCVGYSTEIAATNLSTTSETEQAATPTGDTSDTQTSVKAILFQDLNGDLIKESGEPEIPNVTINLTGPTLTQSVVTQGAPNTGLFSLVFEPGTLHLAVDETDTDIPAGYHYAGPSTFVLSSGIVNDLGYLPMVASQTDVCANIDGVQTQVPDGYHIDASGRNCVQFQLGGAPTSNGGEGSQNTPQVLGASTTNISTQVLGASTTNRLSDTGMDLTTVLVLAGIFFVCSVGLLLKSKLKAIFTA